MRLRLSILLACLAGVLLTAGPAAPLTGGEQDTAHGYVGFLAFVTAHPITGAPLVFVCSGSLVDANTVVTAGHCFPPGAPVQFYLDDQVTRAQVIARSGFEAQGTFIRHPGFAGFGSADVGVVELSSTLPGPYAALPAAGASELLGPRTSMTVVGYGVQDFATGHGPPRPVGAGTRKSASVHLIPSNDVLSPLYLRFQGGSTSACFGDSGGPHLIGDTIYATTSFGTNHMCAGRWEAYRLDTPQARGFLGAFVSLP